MDDDESGEGDNVVPSSLPSGGRGRGRGGGVPVLPTGMWNSLNSTASSTNNQADGIDTSKSNNEAFADVASTLPMSSTMAIPMGFGNKGGGRGAGRGRGSGRGMQRDVKGPDWDCPSCTNVNWAWRDECNQVRVPSDQTDQADKEDQTGGSGVNRYQQHISWPVGSGSQTGGATLLTRVLLLVLLYSK